jgi:uncharacterized Zn finger protein
MAEDQERTDSGAEDGPKPDGERKWRGQNQPKKPKVRIGPRNRRPDPPAPATVPKPDLSKAAPQGRGPGKSIIAPPRKKRRRHKGQNPNAESQPRPVQAVRDTLAPQAGSMVLPPVQDDMDEIPSGLFNVARPDLDDDSSVDSDISSVDSEAGAGAEPSPQPQGSPNPRDRHKRHKRRNRPELPPLDKTKDFWWAEQWIRSFEMLHPSNASRSRMAKGRTYARRGQVVELEVGPNGVLARVQGSRPRPYQVRLELNRLRRETWGRVLHHLAGKAAFLAQLLEGNLPAEIEDLFFASGARLFPHGDNDVRSRCNCPDPVSPCKHVAALNYALADALQRDPFLLFALRGKSRDQFLQDLRDMRGRDQVQSAAAPLQEDLRQFWRMGRLAESVLRPAAWNMGGDPARLVQSLGEPDLEGIREGAFLPLLESTYRQVSEAMRRLPKDA